MDCPCQCPCPHLTPHAVCPRPFLPRVNPVVVNLPLTGLSQLEAEAGRQMDSYLTLEDVVYLSISAPLSGEAASEVSDISENDYLTLDEVRGLAGYADAAEAEPDYLSVDQMAAMSKLFVGPTGDDEPDYLSVEEAAGLAAQFGDRLREETAEASYLSIDEMQDLAGKEALRCWVTSKARQPQPATGDRVWLSRIRDALVRDALIHTRQALDADSMLARRLQRQELESTAAAVAGIRLARLLALESDFSLSVAREPGMAAGSFKELMEAFSNPAYECWTTPRAPDFDAFDRLASTAFVKCGRIIRAAVSTKPGAGAAIVHLAAGVVTDVERALGALGQASAMDIADGIHPCNLKQMLALFWRSARKLKRRGIGLKERFGLRARAFRLRFLLGRLLAEPETSGGPGSALARVDEASIRQKARADHRAPAPDPAKVDRIWACAFCDTINQPRFLACWKCSATKKEAERPAEWGALTPSEARELYE